MLTWNSMYWCGSYKGSKWGVQTAPPSKHLPRCYLSTRFNSVYTSGVLEHKWRASLKTILFLYE